MLSALEALSRHAALGRAVTVLRVLVVFGCVSFAWVFFKLPNFDHATSFIGGMFANHAVGHSARIYRSLVLVYALPCSCNISFHGAGLKLHETAAAYLYGIMAASRSSRRAPYLIHLFPVLGRAMDKAGNWLVRFGATFLLLWAGCWAAPRLFAEVCRNFRHDHGPDAGRHDRPLFPSAAQNVVLAGSSLSFRLKEQYFEHGNVRNTRSMAARALSGMAKNAAAPLWRERVAVETNILERPVDDDLVERFKNAKLRTETLRPLRSLAAYYQGVQDDTITYSRGRIDAIIARPPAPDHSAQQVAEILGERNKPAHREEMAEGAASSNRWSKGWRPRASRFFSMKCPTPGNWNGVSTRQWRERPLPGLSAPTTGAV